MSFPPDEAKEYVSDSEPSAEILEAISGAVVQHGLLARGVPSTSSHLMEIAVSDELTLPPSGRDNESFESFTSATASDTTPVFGTAHTPSNSHTSHPVHASGDTSNCATNASSLPHFLPEAAAEGLILTGGLKDGNGESKRNGMLSGATPEAQQVQALNSVDSSPALANALTVEPTSKTSVAKEFLMSLSHDQFSSTAIPLSDSEEGTEEGVVLVEDATGDAVEEESSGGERDGEREEWSDIEAYSD